MEIEVYSKPNCSWCANSKKLLRENGYSFTEYILGEHFSRQVLLDLNCPLTLPQIFVKMENEQKKLIGGYKELIYWILEEKR